MLAFWAKYLLQRALKSCPKCNKSPNLVTLDTHHSHKPFISIPHSFISNFSCRPPLNCVFVFLQDLSLFIKRPKHLPPLHYSVPLYTLYIFCPFYLSHSLALVCFRLWTGHPSSFRFICLIASWAFPSLNCSGTNELKMRVAKAKAATAVGNEWCHR